MSGMIKQLIVKHRGNLVGKIRLEVVIEMTKNVVQRKWRVTGTEEFLNDYTGIKSNQHQLDYEKKYQIEPLESEKDIDVDQYDITNSKTMERVITLNDTKWV